MGGGGGGCDDDLWDWEEMGDRCSFHTQRVGLGRMAGEGGEWMMMGLRGASSIRAFVSGERVGLAVMDLALSARDRLSSLLVLLGISRLRVSLGCFA